jgi:hypothetical protein
LKDEYKISTNLNNIHTSYVFLSTDIVGRPIQAQENWLGNNNTTPAIPRTVTPPNPNSKVAPNIGWVGFDKLYFGDLRGTYRQSEKEIYDYSIPFADAYLKKLYNNVNFTVYVTKPLKFWSKFKIKTFNAETDSYYYKQIDYSFNKSDNIITAIITGENVPRALMGEGLL